MPTLYPRYNILPVDDSDSRFQYVGSWQEIKGSGRQWDSGIKATQQSGATVSFSFVGSDAYLYHTISTGSGNVVVDVSVDGGAPTRVTRTCGQEPIFDDIFFRTPIMAAVKHTVVITNRSPPSIPFLFDKVDLHAQDFATMLAMAAPAPSSKPAAPTTKAPVAVTTAAPAIITPPPSSADVIPSQNDQVPSSSSPLPGQDQASSAQNPASNGIGSSANQASLSLTGSPQSASATLTLALQSKTVITTTDAQGATVTQTKAIGGTTAVEIFGPTSTDGVVAGTSANSTPLALILAVVFGAVALILLVVAIILCMRRRKRSRKLVENISDGPQRKLLTRDANVIPSPFMIERTSFALDPQVQYPVGSTAIYRDEKRSNSHNNNVVVNTSPVATTSSNAYQHPQPSKNIYINESDRGLLDSPSGHSQNERISPVYKRTSTIIDSAPPAYHVDIPSSQRSSIGSSFYK